MLATPMPSSTAASPGLALSLPPGAPVAEGAGFGALLQRVVAGLTEAPGAVPATLSGMGAAALPAMGPGIAMAAPEVAPTEAARMVEVPVVPDLPQTLPTIKSASPVTELAESHPDEASAVVIETAVTAPAPAIQVLTLLLLEGGAAPTSLAPSALAPTSLVPSAAVPAPPGGPLASPAHEASVEEPAAAEPPAMTGPALTLPLIGAPAQARAQPAAEIIIALPVGVVPRVAPTRGAPDAHPTAMETNADTMSWLEPADIVGPELPVPPSSARADAIAPSARPPPPPGPVPEVAALSLGSMPVTAPTVQPGAAAGPAPTAPPSPVRQVLPLAIAMLIAPGSAPTLTITLEPGEMGRLEIRIGRDAQGTTLRLIAERPETTALMQRDARELQHGLAQSGITLDAAAIRFETAGGGGQQRDRPSPREQPARAGLATPETEAPTSLLDLRI